MENKKIKKIICFAAIFIMLAAGIGSFFVNTSVKAEKEQDLLGGRSIEELCGFNPPDDWWKNVKFYFMDGSAGQPSSFDWRDEGGVTPVKDQGNCGSCWAFGTVAPLESAIKIREDITVDLSEQWLVSCNRDGWGCNGGWWAHDYHQYKTGKCGGYGAVLEDDFPYSASDESCGGPYDHEYIVEDWGFIGGEGSVPPTEDIKQAIIDYGPVSAAVRASSGWSSYDGTYVYDDHAPGSVNHAITIVGWDDNMGSNGAWIVKNSWGSGWGDNGYMYIEYGCSSVGYSACFVNGYHGPPSETEEKITFTVKEITNDPERGDFERIDPILNKPEWYYRVGATASGETDQQFNYNMWTEDLGNFGYNSEYTWEPQQDHVFHTDQQNIEVKLKLMENDELTEWALLLKDDLADISAVSGGGVQNGADQEKRAAIYHGTYNLVTGEITGDTTSDPDSEGYVYTIGDGDENAKVWFKITDSYNEDLYEPEISVSPSTLSFGEVKQDENPSKTFSVENLADFDENGWQKLDWSASDNKNWISLSKTSGSLNGGESDTVTVTLDTEQLQKGYDYSGTITVDSNDETKTIGVSVSIKKSSSIENPFYNMIYQIYERLIEFLQKFIPINSIIK